MKSLLTCSHFVLFLALVLFLNACNDDDPAGPEPNHENKALIINEGPFQNGTGSVTLFDRSTFQSTPEVFKETNGWPLGNIVQSASVFNGMVYIAVNNANKLEVADFVTMASVATVEVTLPRYFIGISQDQGYISSWNEAVYVLDLGSNTINDTIPVDGGPDRMLLVSGKVFVVNSGGFLDDNRVTVIDAGTNQVIRSVTVGDNPAGLVVDRNEKLWVLCSGKGWNGFPSPDDTPGSLHRLDPVGLDQESTIMFDDASVHPSRLEINDDGSTLYALFPDGVYVMGIGEQGFGATPLIKGSFYGLSVDHQTGRIYVTDPVDYVQRGWVKSYLPDGTQADSLKAGIIPSGVSFP